MSAVQDIPVCDICEGIIVDEDTANQEFVYKCTRCGQVWQGVTCTKSNA